jgi:pyrimidine deaminase RibD-like protein/NTP pyrophosphatase (non-canonical NTP hydrolase)
METELQDRHFIFEAILEAEKSVSEDQRVHPKVGVVVVDAEGEVLRQAHRIGGKGHAEFLALKDELPKGKTFAGATMYTTLEPCAYCDEEGRTDVQRIIDRKISRVVIGMRHPDQQLQGGGERRLRAEKIRIDPFPAEFQKQVEEMNRKFIQTYQESGVAIQNPEEFFKENHRRSIDDWYRTVNSIYWNRNYYCDEMNLFAHLVEISGGLSSLASHKDKLDVDPGSFLAKAVAWWMALCGKARVRSISDMLWTKFPNRCPYCELRPHKHDECMEKRRDHPGPDWQNLLNLGNDEAPHKPTSLSGWQRMFASVYPVGATDASERSYARLCEELGELAEAIRVLPAAPGYFLSEAADVFAWLMHIQNAIETDKRIALSKRGESLERSFCKAYPDCCVDCKSPVCKCPPILESTIGRIAHEQPSPKDKLDSAFMSSEAAFVKFQWKSR